MNPNSSEKPKAEIELTPEERETQLASEAEEPEPENRQAQREKKKVTLHWSDLFDLGEDASGNKVDEATGQPIDNSTYDGMEDLQVRELDEETAPDKVGLGEGEEDDAATAFLNANPPSDDDLNEDHV